MDSDESLATLTKNFLSLNSDWRKENVDIEAVDKKLKALRIDLAKNSFLPTNSVEKTQKELLIARDTLEIATYLSVRKRDIEEFKSHYSQLKCYYYDYKANLPESPYKYELIGLHLLSLLAQGKLAEFHTELERLQDELEKHIYLSFPVSLEQFLTEGSFNKLFNSTNSMPTEKFSYFMDILLETVRAEIISCIESAYDSLVKEKAMKLLYIKDVNMLNKIIKERNWRTNSNGEISFNDQEQNSPDVNLYEHTTKTMLHYTKELEQIV